MLDLERQYWSRGLQRLAGVDEAGRGPLAGPVVAGAVVIPRVFAESEEHGLLAGLTDSKRLSSSAREEFYGILHNSPGVEIGIGVADSSEIEFINVLRATHAAMARAVQTLPCLPDHILVDGLAVQGFPRESTAVVRGDSKSLSIAAASIVAKVYRDARMVEFDAIYPQYGFARHKGYGTAAHIQALFEYGPCPIHRATFRPVKEASLIRRRSTDGQSM